MNNINTNTDLEEIDVAFIQSVLNEVQVSCALPLKIPINSVVSYICQAARWFWETDNESLEERSYAIRNSDICKCDKLNKIIVLPQQIMAVHGVFKTDNKYDGDMGDFALERVLMNNYTFSYGGAQGGAMYAGTTNWSLTDVVSSLYELSTFDDFLNTPITYNNNKYSHKLVLLGDLGYSDLVINVMQRCGIHELYNNYWFFRYCVCLVKKGLSTIYGTLEFKLPGGVTINYSKFSDEAEAEMDKIEERLKSNYSDDYFFVQGTN